MMRRARPRMASTIIGVNISENVPKDDPEVPSTEHAGRVDKPRLTKGESHAAAHSGVSRPGQDREHDHKIEEPAPIVNNTNMASKRYGKLI